MFDSKIQSRKISLKYAKGHTDLKSSCYIQNVQKPGMFCKVENVKIDTGAHTTVIPQRYWEAIVDPSDVKKLLQDDIVGVGGFRIEAYVGALNLIMIGLPGEFSLKSNDCKVLFAFDKDAYLAKSVPSQIMNLLIGMTNGPLEKGGLCVNVSKGKAHLIHV